MARVRIIPVLLMSKGGLYKTIRFQNAKYVGDPINSVKIFNEKQADEIILLDFLASKEKRGIDFSKIEEIAGEAFMPMAYGGAIKNFEDAKRVFDCGFEKSGAQQHIVFRYCINSKNCFGLRFAIGCWFHRYKKKYIG